MAQRFHAEEGEINGEKVTKLTITMALTKEQIAIAEKTEGITVTRVPQMVSVRLLG